jgi:hypothetical protein
MGNLIMKYRERGQCSMEVKRMVCAYREKFPVTSEFNITKHLPLLWYKPSVNAVSVIHSVQRFSGKIYHVLTQSGEKCKTWHLGGGIDGAVQC